MARAPRQAMAATRSTSADCGRLRSVRHPMRHGEPATPPRPAPPPAPAAVSLSEVTVLRDGRAVLEGIHWEVAAGERWVVLGPNGSGKTTLLQIAGARLMPSRGKVTVVGEPFGRSDLRTVRARVSLVSAATARALRPFLSARDVVVTGRDAALYPIPHRYSEEDWAAADHALERIAGPDATVLRDLPIGVLSEGERQRVLLARALMGAAELILLDEPAAGLDLAAREHLVTRLGKLAADPTVPAMVLVTHHLEEVPPGFTHALLLAGGRVAAAGRIEDVLTSQLVSECYGLRVDVARSAGRWWAQAIL